LYLIALGAVSLALLGALFEAVASVSRKPKWATLRPGLRLVHTSERRSHALPFVGAERRSAGEDTDDAAERKAA
jgi:hypothetical protein